MSDLTLPLGTPRSGRARYAAAMALYQTGQISAEALEVYRICSLLDGQDPAPLLAAADLPAARIATLTAEAALRALVTALDTYLATMPGPGVAEVRQGLNRWQSGPVTPHQGAANRVLATHHN